MFLKRLTWSLLILIAAIWAVILVYWVGTGKNQPAPKPQIENSSVLSPANNSLATDSADIATMSSSSVKITTGKITVKY